MAPSHILNGTETWHYVLHSSTRYDGRIHPAIQFKYRLQPKQDDARGHPRRQYRRYGCTSRR